MKDLLFAVLVAIIVFLALDIAHAQEGLIDSRPQGWRGWGHEDNHERYNALPNNRNGGSCCHQADCRPTSARWVDTPFSGKVSPSDVNTYDLPDGHWEVLVDGEWQIAPYHTIMDQAYLQARGQDRWDTMAHVCASSTKRILCVIPPDSGG